MSESNEIRPLNRADLDVRELESRLELLVAAPNPDFCWNQSCTCASRCDYQGCAYLV